MCQTLENLISVLYDQRDNQAASSLQPDDDPRERRIVLEKAILGDSLAILEEDDEDEAENQGKQGHLDVADPDSRGRWQLIIVYNCLGGVRRILIQI